MPTKPTRTPIALFVLLLGMLAGTCTGQDSSAPELSPEVREAADVLNKAPFALLLAAAQHYLDKGRWPHEYSDVHRVLEANARVLPKSFSFGKVTFRDQTRKGCTVDFAFDWPTLEGGGAAGTIVMSSGGSLKEIAKTSKISWKKPPKIRADLMPAEPAPAPPAAAPAN